jgi:hypothetical protein
VWRVVGLSGDQVLATLALAAVLIWFLHGKQTRLRADLVVTNTSIGIPGVSKMYEAVLINEGTLPLPVTRWNSAMTPLL